MRAKEWDWFALTTANAMDMTRPDHADPAIPRFGIFHLITLTTGVAVYLGWVEFTKSFQPVETRLENQNLTLILNLLFRHPSESFWQD